MITFNHEKYIAESIQSVLDQTYKDIELVVVNDGSTDGTEAVIKSFSDPRIHYIYQENQGPSSATNNGVKAARSELIWTFSGDDVAYPQKLEAQIEAMKITEADAVFTWVDFIDDDSNFLHGKNHFAANFFNLPNVPSPEILNHLFFKGNYLCAVTPLILKHKLSEVDFWCLPSLRLQDYDMWIKLLGRNCSFYMLEERLVKYRIRSGNQNLSNQGVTALEDLETYEILKSFFDEMSMWLFKEAFSKQLINPLFESEVEYEIEKSFIYLRHTRHIIRSIGLSRLFQQLQDPKYINTIREKYNLSTPAFFELAEQNFRFQDSLSENLATLNKEKLEILEAHVRRIHGTPPYKIYRLIKSLAKKCMCILQGN